MKNNNFRQFFHPEKSRIPNKIYNGSVHIRRKPKISREVLIWDSSHKGIYIRIVHGKLDK